jgi:hypothetical protein
MIKETLKSINMKNKSLAKSKKNRKSKINTNKNIIIKKQLLFECNYDIDKDLKLCFGLEPSKNFIPCFWILQDDRRVGITKKLWKLLSEHKKFIQIRLNSAFTPSVDESLDIPYNSKLSLLFKLNQSGHTAFVIKQSKLMHIELTAETWEKFITIEALISSILKWMAFSADNIKHFYYSQYIPKCVEKQVDCLTKESIHIATGLKPEQNQLIHELSLLINNEKITKDIKKYKSVNSF